MLSEILRRNPWISLVCRTKSLHSPCFLCLRSYWIRLSFREANMRYWVPVIGDVDPSFMNVVVEVERQNEEADEKETEENNEEL